MSLTAISQYASTASITPWVTRASTTSQLRREPVQSLASGEVQDANGRNRGFDAASKTSVNVTYDRLSRQSDIGPSGNVNPSLKSFLASYEENSGTEASSQSSGTLFRAIA